MVGKPEVVGWPHEVHCTGASGSPASWSVGAVHAEFRIDQRMRCIISDRVHPFGDQQRPLDEPVEQPLRHRGFAITPAACVIAEQAKARSIEVLHPEFLDRRSPGKPRCNHLD